MLTGEMEYIHHKANILEDRVTFDHFSKGAIVVKEDVVWHKIIDAIRPNDHLLCA